MLVLSRRESDTIRLPDLDITIEVLGVKGNSVRLGFDAPMEIKILRGELDGDPQVAKQFSVSGSDEHETRNIINSLKLSAAMAERHLAQKRPELAANVLCKAIDKLEASRSELQTIASAQPPLPTKNPTAHGLLVEDSENERTMLAGLLRLHGYRVDTVTDGVEALNFLGCETRPDFILMDMCMPRMDGASAIRAIRNSSSFDDISIYAVSGQSPADVGIDVGSNRVAEWFQKPIEPMVLLQSISNRLEQSNN